MPIDTGDTAWVAITPAAGYVNSLGTIVIGLLAGAAGLYAVRLKFRHGYDDSLDVVGVQAPGVVVAAAWAFVMTGLVALSVHKVLGLRATPEDELAGLDMSIHAETAYDHGAFGGR